MTSEIFELPKEPEYTGRMLVVGRPHKSSEAQRAIKNAVGLNIASSRDYEGQSVTAESIESGDGIYFDEIGVAVVTPSDADQLGRMTTMSALAESAEGPVLEPEQMMYALGGDYSDYVRGFRDATNALADRYAAAESWPEGISAADAEALAVGTTWGLQKTRTVVSIPFLQGRTGRGIKVCVLDTGMDLDHPDFGGRNITSRSFVPGEAVQDQNRHGTHCIGTACGPKEPPEGTTDRYGVAYEADIFAGKVLSNAGSGADGWILAGINWAVASRCEVISMSLGAMATDSGFSQAYENAALAALNVGSLIVAAAGNDSRFGLKPVSRPANSPSIMAVGALDQNLRRAAFSNVTFHAPHGKVDISGPGVDVLSAIPVAMGTHGTLSGTSMATPHVAGIAALIAESGASYRGSALWQRLVATAEAVSGEPAGHVGSGIVQAPYLRNVIVKPLPWWWWKFFSPTGQATAQTAE